MRWIDADTTRRHLPLPALIAALRAAFVAGAQVPARHAHPIGRAGAADRAGTLLVMPAWRPGGRLGVKTVTVFPANGARGLPSVHAVYTLFDATSGVPLAQIDGSEITARRTAAASALAASLLARADASRLLVVGAGRVAALLPEAFAAVRPIRHVAVWNRHPAAAEALAARWRAAGIDAQAVASLAAAVAGADIVSSATLSTAALIRGEWLRAGVHLDLIGSFTPAMCEADALCFARSRVFVDSAEALVKSGDLLQAAAGGAFSEGDLQGTLETLCRGGAGRRRSGEITLFKAVGHALEDLAAAELVVDGVLSERPSPTAPVEQARVEPARNRR